MLSKQYFIQRTYARKYNQIRPQLLYMEAKRMLEEPKEIGQIPGPFIT
jgi:hypothetical protein